MRDIEGLDVSEIVAMLHVTSNTVKARLHRAGQGLRPILERELNGLV